jgi:hypothetical protein
MDLVRFEKPDPNKDVSVRSAPASLPVERQQGGSGRRQDASEGYVRSAAGCWLGPIA